MSTFLVLPLFLVSSLPTRLLILPNTVSLSFRFIYYFVTSSHISLPTRLSECIYGILSYYLGSSLSTRLSILRIIFIPLRRLYLLGFNLYNRLFIDMFCYVTLCVIV